MDYNEATLHLDGYRFYLDLCPQDCRMSLVLHRNGEPVPGKDIALGNLSARDLEGVNTLANLGNALARYLNHRGSPQRALEMVQAVAAAPTEELLPSPYTLQGLCVLQASTSLWGRPDGSCLRVVEDEFTEVHASLAEAEEATHGLDKEEPTLVTNLQIENEEDPGAPPAVPPTHLCLASASPPCCN